MGNQSSNSNLDNFPQDFKYIKTITHHPYGKAKLFQNILTKQHIAMITVEDVKSEISRIQKYSNLNTGIIKFLDWCEEGTETLQSRNSVSLFYEYCPSTLSEQINLKKKKGNSFSEKEIWYVLNKIVQMALSLQVKQLSHTDIRPSNVLISDNNAVKFAPIGIFPFDITSYQKYIYTNEPTYLAPENHKQSLTQINWSSNDIFSTGLTILDMMTLSNSFHLYDQERMMSIEISKKLSSQMHNYSQDLINIVKRMLMVDPNKRIKLQELNVLLKPVQTEIDTLQSFTISKTPPVPIQTNQSEYYVLQQHQQKQSQQSSGSIIGNSPHQKVLQQSNVKTPFAREINPYIQSPNKYVVQNYQQTNQAAFLPTCYGMQQMRQQNSRQNLNGIQLTLQPVKQLNITSHFEEPIYKMSPSRVKFENLTPIRTFSFLTNSSNYLTKRNTTGQVSSQFNEGLTLTSRIKMPQKRVDDISFSRSNNKSQI